MLSTPCPIITSPLFSTATTSVNSSPPRVHFHPTRAFSYLVSSSSSSPTSLYDILGVPTSSTCHEIKTAYRRLARVCHPDVAAFEMKGTSADDFMRINDANSTLCDPEKRAEYDRKMFWRVRPLSEDYSGYFTGRNWETDQCW